MKKAAAICAVALLFAWAAPAGAQDAGQIVLKDALYGAAIGTLVGGAFMLFTDDPGDHLEYLGYGAGAGILGGTAFGFWEAAAWTTVENGKVKIAWPTLNADAERDGVDVKITRVWTDLLKFKW
ncbi:MAG: hypothetical protein JRI97_03495 [Deltaproteobacteria bacterium]|nr:hypothetical protein [Deltaproteobacteria bacterium]